MALVGKGVVLNKDGSFQRTARFRGPDLDSAVSAELIAVAGRLNNAFRRLGSGWAIFVEAQRHPSNGYPDSRFAAGRFTVADIMMADVLRQTRRADAPAYPNIRAYKERACARPAFKKVHADQVAHFVAGDQGSVAEFAPSGSSAKAHLKRFPAMSAFGDRLR